MTRCSNPARLILLLDRVSVKLFYLAPAQVSDMEAVLGKRARNNDEEHQNAADDSEPSSKKSMAEDMEESDDDVGPMPMPADGMGVTKKKRKGELQLRLVSGPHKSYVSSSSTRASLSRTSTECGPILQIFHAS